MILTVDLGTSVTKVGLWSPDGLESMGRAALDTYRPQLGWAEQEPDDWWRSLVDACGRLPRQVTGRFSEVRVIALTGARQIFVPVDRGGVPLGRAIVWSDRRAGAEAAALADALGGPGEAHALTGVPLEAGAVGPKLAWLASHEPERLAGARWLLAPRDLIAWRLTGEFATDPSMRACMGIDSLDGRLVEPLGGAVAGLLPVVVASTSVIGSLGARPAAELGLPAGTPVVIGAGDRQCEVLGSGATPTRPMVSWGTTANVSLPLASRPAAPKAGLMLGRSASGGWQYEAGSSAAGSWLAWLARVTDRSVADLLALAATSPPGARGVIAAAWLDGARAPWWDDRARAGFAGIGADHGLADLARAAVESVAWDLRRSLGLMADDVRFDGLALAGAGGTAPLWVDVVTSITGLAGHARRSGEAASAGAALLGARAIGVGDTDLDWADPDERLAELDRIDPPAPVTEPEPATVAAYADLADRADRTAASLLRIQ